MGTMGCLIWTCVPWPAHNFYSWKLVCLQKSQRTGFRTVIDFASNMKELP